MAFTGKATYNGGADLPEIAEDVSELVSLAAVYDTPLLDALGDPARPARSTIHEWLEDSLLSNQVTFNNAETSTTFEFETVVNLRVGDQLAPVGGGEVLLATAVDYDLDKATFTRGYGGTTQGTYAEGHPFVIIGNAALEGADADVARFTVRSRMSNYTQIFAKTVEVSGSELAVRQIGVRDELEYQKGQRLRELMRDLENSVINGSGSASPGTSVTRRTFNGLLRSVTSRTFTPGGNGFPADTALTEEQLNLALRSVWEEATSNIDLIVVGGREKRAINQFVSSDRRFAASTERFKDRVSVYESDFGACRVVLSRYVPQGTVFLLDSSRIDVLPLAGRSFHYKPLARTGDSEAGQLVGEYTLEVRNEAAHGVITGLTT